MARSLRIERSGGVYHVINRGNYRQDLFINDGAHEAFERCLFEACEKCGWVLEGFCVMTNHFHLVLRTPNGNLVYGMKWFKPWKLETYLAFASEERAREFEYYLKSHSGKAFARKRLW